MEMIENPFSLFEQEDRKLFEKIAVHDEGALFSLLDRYSPFMFSVLMRMMRSVEDAETIIHDTFIEIWNKKEKYAKSDDITYYEHLLKVVRERALSTERLKHLKKQSQQPGHQILPIYSEHVLSQPPNIPLRSEILQNLINVFLQLTEEEQQVLAMAFYEGWSQREIAKRLSIPAWTINWSLRKSLNSIASVVFGLHPADDETHPKKYTEMCAGYVVGILPSEDLKEFVDHREENCVTCSAEIARLKNAIFLLPFGLPQIAVSPELRDRIQFSIQLVEVVRASNQPREEAQEAEKVGAITDVIKESGEIKIEKTRVFKWLPVILAGALIVSIALNVYFFSDRNKNNRPVDIDSSKIILQQDVEKKNLLLGILEKEKIDIVFLKSEQKNNNQFGKIIWDQVTRSALLQVSLPMLNDKDSIYSLWLVTADHMIKVGNFSSRGDDKKEKIFRLQLPTDVARNEIKEFWITLEQDEGSSKPSSNLMLKGYSKIK
ncbi:MAG: sigma-70 family RNA polymerase sigma factor [Ignavibacteriales bacterium]|nr:sigma-70 family RNA polymerase sigma factor [Ignavibacteriales bacterium]